MILALAILAGAIAVLGEISRLALQNATAARDLSRAQILAESKLAKIQSGMISAQAVEETAFDTSSDSADPADPGWLYSISTQSTDEDGTDLRPRDGHARRAGQPAPGEVLAGALDEGPQLHLHAAHFGYEQHEQFFHLIGSRGIIT